jgi:hypothetical protein
MLYQDIIINFDKLKGWKKLNKRRYRLTPEEFEILSYIPTTDIKMEPVEPMCILPK